MHPDPHLLHPLWLVLLLFTKQQKRRVVDYKAQSFMRLASTTSLLVDVLVLVLLLLPLIFIFFLIFLVFVFFFIFFFWFVHLKYIDPTSFAITRSPEQSFRLIFERIRSGFSKVPTNKFAHQEVPRVPPFLFPPPFFFLFFHFSIIIQK